MTGPVGIVFDAQGRLRRYRLQANTIYCFVSRDQKLDLSKFGGFRHRTGQVFKPAKPSASDAPATSLGQRTQRIQFR